MAITIARALTTRLMIDFSLIIIVLDRFYMAPPLSPLKEVVHASASVTLLSPRTASRYRHSAIMAITSKRELFTFELMIYYYFYIEFIDIFIVDFLLSFHFIFHIYAIFVFTVKFLAFDW